MAQPIPSWKADVLLPLLEHRDSKKIPRTLQDQSIVLLSADVDRIQDYVFESARLPEIRGASMLVSELNSLRPSPWGIPTVGALFDAAQLPPEAAIYSEGGSLLAILPDLETAQKLQAQIQELFPGQTGLVTITCVIHETTVGELLSGYRGQALSPENIWALRATFPTDWTRVAAAYGCTLQDGQEAVLGAIEKERCFGQMVEFMSLLLRRAKDDRRIPLFHEVLPHHQRCRSCGRRAANFVGQYREVEETWPLCRPCALKLKDRADRRSAWLYEDRDDSKPALSSRYYGSRDPENIFAASDLTEIGTMCQARPGYVGFIYADGDSIGKFMTKQRMPHDYREASQRLVSATRSAVYESLANFLQPQQIKRKSPRDGSEELAMIHPFEIITIGGDDVLLIVPADVAIPIALNICQLFSQKLQSDGLTMSAGVVLAQSHNPVRVLRDIATQLLKSAKRRACEVQGSGGLDFLVLTSQSMLRRDVPSLRATYPIKLPGEGASAGLRLTGAPYTLQETSQLLRLLRLMRQKGFPTSQLHQMVAALYQGREYGSLHFLYQQARLHTRPYGKILKDIHTLWDFETKDPIPWQEVNVEGKRPDPDSQIRYISLLPDLADLCGFVPAEESLLARWDVLIQEVAHADLD